MILYRRARVENTCLVLTLFSSQKQTWKIEKTKGTDLRIEQENCKRAAEANLRNGK